MNAYRTMSRALAVAAVIGVATFSYMLFICGSSANGIIFALAMTLFTFAMSIWTGVTLFLE